MSGNPGYIEGRAKAWGLGICLGLLLAMTGTALAEDEVLTPDHPGYVEKITREQLDVISAEGPLEKAELCLRFCHERRREMGAVLQKGREKHLGLLADAWLILAFDGAMKTARQGSDDRYDMVKTYARIGKELEASQAAFRAMAQKGLSGEALRTVERVRIQAGLGVREARTLGEKERLRVQQHNAMLAQGRTRVREALQKNGVAREALEAVTEELMAGCARHGSIHGGLLARVASQGSEGSRAGLAVAANFALDAGCAEQTVARLSARTAAQGEGGVKLQTRLLNEAGRLLRRCERNRKASARNLDEFMGLCEQLRIQSREMTGILRQVQRMVRAGMTVDEAVDLAREEIRTHGALPEKAQARQESALKLMKKIRSRVRRKVQQLKKEKARFTKKPGPGKGTGK